MYTGRRRIKNIRKRSSRVKSIAILSIKQYNKRKDK